MRLTTQQIHGIKQVAAEVFGGEAQVHLFGSRVDDERRGGDIDLHITGCVVGPRNAIGRQTPVFGESQTTIGRSTH